MTSDDFHVLPTPKLKQATKTDLAVIRGDIRLLKWMIGVVLACVAFPILKSFLV